MRRRLRPVIAYPCPHCGNETVVQRKNGPVELLDWEDTLFVETIFECTHCEWSEMIGRNPVQNASAAG